MQMQILNGIFADGTPELRTSFPVNLCPVPIQSGISTGFLRPADGIVELGNGPGRDRGGINWRDKLYRVMSDRLVEIDSSGAVTDIGDVGPGGSVTFVYSFDALAIASGGRLYYYDDVNLTQVTDPDLGVVLDVVWVDGYFMTTDGEFLVVTELNDPFAVNPLKYGSAEVDPDPIVAVLKLRNEIYALNRHTIEVFDNVGGDLFPFRRIDGAQVQKGAIGTHACCVFAERVAFLGSGVNEGPGIHIAMSSNSQKISTQDIDEVLRTFTEQQLSIVKLESRSDNSHNFLYVHLPDRTLVYDSSASEALNAPVWTTLTSAVDGFQRYRAQNFVWVYDKWMIGDPGSTKFGHFTKSISTHFGETVRWEFNTSIVYNNGAGAIFKQLELVALTGSVAIGKAPTISTSYSVDGQVFSQERSIAVGTTGQTSKRLVWFQQGHMRNWRVQRFRGTSDSHVSFVRLEIQLDPLAY